MASGLSWQGLAQDWGLQGKSLLSPGQVSYWLPGALSTFPASLASLYSCFPAGPVFSAPKELTSYGNGVWAWSLGSWGRLFPQATGGLCSPV